MPNVDQDNLTHPVRSLPDWFRQELPDSSSLKRMRGILSRNRLTSVCQEARCPNTGECWQRGTATLMILGEICTRSCRFCSVTNGHPSPVDPREPERVGQTVRQLGLNYAVITSVTRDDLSDGGSGHFAITVEQIRRHSPDTAVELLIPDFQGQRTALETVIASRPQVLGHNLETVKRLQPRIRPQADYHRSLQVLRTIRDVAGECLIKSGFMVGLGETPQEVRELLADLKSAGCDLLTIGQYLAPSKAERHLPVARFVSPREFSDYEDWAKALGFRFVMSGPLVRSSFFAEQGYRSVSNEKQQGDS